MDRPWLALGVVFLLAPPIPFLPRTDSPSAVGANVPLPAEGPVLAVPGSGFIENAGQLADDSIRFYTTGPVSAAFTDAGVIFQVRGPESAAFYTMRFAGARAVRPAGIDRTQGDANYFLGNDPSKWRSGVGTYQGLLYAGLYPGVDLRFLSRDGGLKYEFAVAPGADPGAIALAFEGASPSVEGDALLLETPAGTVRDAGFAVYQQAGAGRAPVRARMVAEGGRLRYDIGAYDRSRPLVIDPLISTTVLGGSGDDYAIATAVDRLDNGYIAGETLSRDFPTTGSAYSVRPAGANSTFDIFVVKLTPDGKRVLFSTYIGSSGNDFVHDLRVDVAGFVYLTGYTYGFDLPTTNGSFDRTYNGYGDAFALKLSPAGTKLQFSTFLGGDDVDFGYALALGEDGSVYIAGGTASIDFPTTAGALQTSIKAGTSLQDGFVLRLTPDGSALRYCTYLGGGGMDYVLAVQADGEGCAFVTGATTSPDFPTTAGAFSSHNRDQDAFVAKLDPSGSSLRYSTFVGGAGTDVGNALALDESGGCFIAGDTSSYDLPATPRPATGQYHGYWDSFAARLDEEGAQLTFCGYIGGYGDESAAALLLDAGGNLTIAGTTDSVDLATTPAAEQGKPPGGQDLFIARLDAGGRHLIYQGYFGGKGNDSCAGAALDLAGNVCLAGTTSSADIFGPPGAAANGTEVFLARLAPVCVPGPPGLKLVTGNHTVELEWTEPEWGAGGILGYVLCRGLSTSELNVSWRLPAELRAFKDVGVDNGVNHYYSILAVNASGEGERSAPRTAMPGLRPSPPRSLSAVGRPSKVVLSWQPPELTYDMPLLRYRVYRWTLGNLRGFLREVAGATTYEDSSVYNDFTYFYEVTAVNIIGESEPSDRTGGLPSERPSPPQNLSAYLDGRAVTLSWDAPENRGIGSIVDYSVFYQLEDGRRRLVGRTLVMLYVDKDLLAGTYHYRVLANSTVGEGYLTDEAVVNITNLPPVASFTVDSLEGTSMAPFNFSSTSYDRDTFIVNYTWEFGDGSSAHKQDPAHFYPRRGVYNVTLRVRDVDGAEACSTGMVSVLNTPPSIGACSPGASIIAYKGRSREFSITPLDPDRDTLETTWLLNGSVAGTGHKVRITFNLTGSYVLEATLSDGEASTRAVWNVTVVLAPPPEPMHVPWYWLLGAALAAAAALTGILLFRRRVAGPRKRPERAPLAARKKALGPAGPKARPVKRASQKDIIRKRYS